MVRENLDPVAVPDEANETTGIGSAVRARRDNKVQRVICGEQTRRERPKAPGIKLFRDDERDDLNDPLGHHDDPIPAGVILESLRTDIRQWRPDLRPETLGNLSLRPPLRQDNPMDFKYVAEAELSSRLMPLEKHPVFRAVPALKTHGAAPEIGAGLF